MRFNDITLKELNYKYNLMEYEKLEKLIMDIRLSLNSNPELIETLEQQLKEIRFNNLGFKRTLDDVFEETVNHYKNLGYL